MKNVFKWQVFLVSFIIFGFNWVAAQSELIEPSRSLKTASGDLGHLTVFSEPPGLAVKLDGSPAGTSPIRIKALDPGIHQLQVGDAVTEIYIEPGQTFHISLFRNQFIQFQATPKEPAEPASPDVSSAADRRAAETPPPQYSTRKENRKAWERWMLFINGSSQHF